MSRRKKPPLTLKERLDRVAGSGAKTFGEAAEKLDPNDDLLSLEERVNKVLGILEDKKKSTDMLFFVMYDIESNKVRNQVVKYLIRSGCQRIQKSIFLAKLDPVVFSKIKSDLAAIQSYYDNDDSILIVPISTDYLSAMKIIGRTIDMDVITKNKNTLFF